MVKPGDNPNESWLSSSRVIPAALWKAVAASWAIALAPALAVPWEGVAKEFRYNPPASDGPASSSTMTTITGTALMRTLSNLFP